MIKINIADEPKQKFSTIFNTRRVTLELWYSVFNDRWSMDISIDGEKILTGRKIVSGVDLLFPFDLDIGVLFAWANNDEPANRDNLPLGIVSIYHTTKEEIDASMAA